MVNYIKTLAILMLLVTLAVGPKGGRAQPPKQQPPPAKQQPQPAKQEPAKQQPQPAKQEPAKQQPPPAKQDPTKSKTPAPTQKGGLADFLAQEKPITWLATSLTGGIGIAKSQKKVLYAYFYFEDKDDFPKNYDETLMRYSEDRAVFARIFVKTDSKGKIMDDEVSNFFTQNKLAKGSTGALLDCYGNFLNTVSSTASNKITPAIDDADTKIADIEVGLNKKYEKAAKLEKELEKDRAKKMPDYIKALISVAEDKYQGYPSVEKAQDKLKELDNTAFDAHKTIIKEYRETDEEEREPEDAIEQLDGLVKTYKGLPTEKLAQESIAIIKKGELPPLPEETKQAPAKEEAKKDAPAADDKSASKPADDDKEPEEDK
jgi:hypothetical protein